MATVIEPGVIGSDEVRRVALLLGVDEDIALAKIIRLWTASQKVGRAKATTDEIAFWIGVIPGEAAIAWVTALSDPLAGFLKRGKKDVFLIAGNRRHITKIRAMKKNARIGGEKTRQKWKGGKSEPSPALDAEPNALAFALANGPDLLGPKPSQAKPSQAKRVGEELSLAKITWLETLKALGVNRENLIQAEELAIFRAMNKHGADAVTQALLGARFEERSEKFDPKKVVSIARILEPNKNGQSRLDYYINLAAQNRARLNQTPAGKLKGLSELLELNREAGNASA